MTIVCGPPASGKSTYVAEHMGANDALIELDAIAKTTFGKPVRLVGKQQRMDCLRLRNEALGKYMRRVDNPPERLWLIATPATPSPSSAPRAGSSQRETGTLSPKGQNTCYLPLAG